MERNVAIFFPLIALIFVAGCVSNELSTKDAPAQEEDNSSTISVLNDADTNETFSGKEENFSITTLQDYDPSLCWSSGETSGGRDYVGVKVQAYDAESGETIKDLHGYLSFEQNEKIPLVDTFSCFQKNPAFPAAVTVSAKGYIPREGVYVGSFPAGKMYLIKVAMHKEPVCYYDENNTGIYDEYGLEQYHDYIKRGFGLDSNQYTLKCMDSDFTRGGFMEANGDYVDGGEFEVLYRWGWSSPAGGDSGWTKCFAMEGKDELFETVKNRICNEIGEESRHDENHCASYTDYDRTEEIRKKCLDNEYGYSVGDKKIISIVQSSDACSSSVKKGGSDCLSIY